MKTRRNKIHENISSKEILRKLFTEHAVFTKFFVNSFLDGSSDIDVITNRLLKNQEDIGNYLSKFIHKENGKIVTEKLKEHILLAAACVKSLKEGKSDLKENIEKLFKNAEVVGAFLSSLNPTKLSKEKGIREFKKHNQYVLDFATQRFKNHHKEEIKTYDEYYNHMLMFSDIIHSLLF